MMGDRQATARGKQQQRRNAAILRFAQNDTELDWDMAMVAAIREMRWWENRAQVHGSLIA
jgi:hypothetical protein